MIPHTMGTQNCVQMRAPWMQRLSPRCQLNQRFLSKKSWSTGITHSETVRRSRIQSSFGSGTTEPVQRSRLKITRVQSPASEGVGKLSGEEDSPLAQQDIDENSDINIEFDNDSTEGRTLVKVEANLDESSTLRQLLMTCWSSLRINVLEASMTTESGRLIDSFEIVTEKGRQVPVSEWDSIRTYIMSSSDRGYKSSPPAIYGVAAEIEVSRLKKNASVSTPKTSSSPIESMFEQYAALTSQAVIDTSDCDRISKRLNEQAEIAISAAAKLELAAAEMAAAASDLVIAEKAAAQSAVKHAEIAAQKQRTILENEEAERTIIILKGVKNAADEAKAEGQTEEAKVLSKAAKAASSTEEEISKWQEKLEETDKLIEKLAEDEEAASIDTNLSEERRREVAAMLERKMAAMEAIIAARAISSGRQPIIRPFESLTGPTTEVDTIATETSSPMSREERTQRLIDIASKQVDSSSKPPLIVYPPPEKPVEPVPEVAEEKEVVRVSEVNTASGNMHEIILQSFNWESCKESWYLKLGDQLDDLKRYGFSCAWLPPACQSVSPQGYMPIDYYNLNSEYGSEQELRELLSECQNKGIVSVADIVINHRCAADHDDRGRWNVYGGKLNWGLWAICSNGDWGGQGSRSTGDNYDPAPNVDHTNEKVREDLKEWLKWMRNDVGFGGWRFDFVKGYSGHFTKEYVEASKPYISFGEYWDTCSYRDGVLDYNQDSHRQRTVNWIDAAGGLSSAFDFTTKGILQEALGRREYWRLTDPRGQPPGLLGMWPSRSVTFLENHDTGSTLGHWRFPWNKVLEGYCYILTHCGTPCVFYDHLMDEKMKDRILEMIQIRKKKGIFAKSKVEVQQSAADLYAAVIDDKIAMKIGPGDWSPNTQRILDSSWSRMTDGPGYAIWEMK